MTEKNEHILIIESAVEWYSMHKYLYEQLSNKVRIIIGELLEINGINIHAIFHRAKELDSFKEKIKDPKYTDPKTQITDLAGIRIICYVESDIPKIRKIIEGNFDIDKENSGDKSKLLGTDKVGYKSIHYVGKLDKTRLVLPEYQNYSHAKFEIQIRTILQHAWAEIEHDRSYKFSGELPEELQRRFKLVAGSLELADKEFDRIATKIDKLNLEVEKGTKEGKLDFEINTTTLKQFLNTKFAFFVPDRIKPIFPTPESEVIILEELSNYGLKKLKDLNDIIPNDFINTLKKAKKVSTNFYGLLRIIMISNDWQKYFDDSFNQGWQVAALRSNDVLEHYKIPVEDIIRKYGKKNK